MTTVKDLQQSSHSGESVALTQYQNRLCVIKRSGRDQERFLCNVQKQKLFRPLALAGLTVAAAPVIEDIRTDTEVGIIMPYIHGLSGADFALHGGRETARDIARALSALLNDSMSRAEIREVPVQVYFDKLDQVRAANRTPALRDPLDAAQRVLRQKLSGLATLATPICECHGDLTLSNIILSHSSGLVLVDFLASFIESPLQDLAKICQELEFGWSFRKLDANLRVKSAVFCELAYPGYAKFLTTLFPVQSYIFRLLCLARIAPYVRDEVTSRWLQGALEQVLTEAQLPLRAAVTSLN